MFSVRRTWRIMGSIELTPFRTLVGKRQFSHIKTPYFQTINYTGQTNVWNITLVYPKILILEKKYILNKIGIIWRKKLRATFWFDFFFNFFFQVAKQSIRFLLDMSNESSKGPPSTITLAFSTLTHFLLLAPVIYILVLAVPYGMHSLFGWHPVCMSIGVSGK